MDILFVWVLWKETDFCFSLFWEYKNNSPAFVPEFFFYFCLKERGLPFVSLALLSFAVAHIHNWWTLGL